MFKKFTTLGILLAMIFCLSACGGLSADKAAAKKMIEAYAFEKGQTNYAVENWAIIENLVTDGKTAIEAATEKTVLEAVTTTAKYEIDAVWSKQDFLAYKADAKTTVKSYVEEKRKNSYTAEDWRTITGLSAQSSTTIDAAADKASVDSTVESAIEAIGAIVPIGISFKVAYLNTNPHPYIDVPEVTIIARDYLTLFPVFNGYSFGFALREYYNENFFESKALLLHVFRAHNGESYFVERIQLGDNSLTLNLVGRGSTPDMDNYPVIVVVEVNKKDISTVKSSDFGVQYRYA